MDFLRVLVLFIFLLGFVAATYVNVRATGQLHLRQLRGRGQVGGAAERRHHGGNGSFEFRGRFVERERPSDLQTRPGGELEGFR